MLREPSHRRWGGVLHLVVLCIGKLEGQLGGLYVESADPGLRPLQQVLSAFQTHPAALHPHTPTRSTLDSQPCGSPTAVLLNLVYKHTGVRAQTL